MSPMNELVRDLDPGYTPIKFDRDRRRIDRQTDNLIPVYPPFNFVEQGYNYLRLTSQEKPQPSITKIDLKITYLKSHSNLPGTNELSHHQA